MSFVFEMAEPSISYSLLPDWFGGFRLACGKQNKVKREGAEREGGERKGGDKGAERKGGSKEGGDREGGREQRRTVYFGVVSFS